MDSLVTVLVLYCTSKGHAFWLFLCTIKEL
jgi:hypothetical protein